MMLVDTHTHLYLPQFEGECEAVVKRAIDAGVEKMIFPNVDISTIAPMRKLHLTFPSNTFMAMGLHPTEVGEEIETVMRSIENEWQAHSDEYIAVGEIGIDLYWDKTFVDKQMEVFSRQIDIAVTYGLPVIIHCRDGLDEVLEVLSGKSELPSGVFHSFGGSDSDIERIREIGDFYFGINGIVTFKNSGLRNTLPCIGIERIILETDSPYLAPVPYRGKRNESAYIINTAQAVGAVFGMSLDEISCVTSENAHRLFMLQ